MPQQPQSAPSAPAPALDGGDPNAAPMGPEPNAAPMDAPMDGGDPNAMNGDMGGDPNAMSGGDPNEVPMGSLSSSAEEEPSMDDAPMGGPDMGGDPSMDEPSEGGDGDDSTMSIINQLSDTDKEAVRSYAQSMLNRDESQNGESDASMGGPDMDGDPNTVPMAESYIFTKKQIQMLRENFGPTADELSKSDNRKPLGKKKTNKIDSRSPFNSPKFK